MPAEKALIRRCVEEVYDQRKLEVVDEIFASDFTLHDPDLPGGAHGPKGIKRIVKAFVDAFPDLQVSLDDEFSSGERVVTRWTAKAGLQRGCASCKPRLQASGIRFQRKQADRLKC